MGVTNETMQAHMTSYETLKGQIMTINKDAETAVNDLNFYADEAEEETKGNKAYGQKLENQLLRIEEERYEEDNEAEI